MADNYIIRRQTSVHDARVVEIHNGQEADSAPWSVEGYRAAREEEGPDSEQWVALAGDRVVGMGSFGPAWWTGEAEAFSVELRVDPDCGRRGAGTRLFETLQERLALQRATRLLAWIREDAVPGRRFAARHGFEETGQVIQEYRLEVGAAGPEAYAGAEERLRSEGIRLVSLAELAPDEAFLREPQAVWADSGEGPPDPGELHSGFDTWRKEVLEGPGLSPDTHWVAVREGRPVGLTFLRRLTEEEFENDYTGVAGAYRGRGIAPALKRCTLAWAREHGVRWFHTSSELGSSPMIAINRRFGYQPGVRRLEVSWRGTEPRDSKDRD